MSGLALQKAWPAAELPTSAVVHVSFWCFAAAMGHNISTRKRSSEALRLPLFHFAGWHLNVDCGSERCHRGRRFVMKDLAACYPAELTLGEALRKLRCRGCGRPPVAVVLRPGPAMDKRRTGAIALVGAGSV